ncbi:HlyD family secretion protein [Fimbriiglobus ruber]|uniref:Multidrug resistance protein [function not yet clear] n=1 Tax=Fimbriiglobus ruber TaxID=1908690 RepID=A0A225DKK8_9BACT|nr:biotin/lipoyl-binding protein [Fimbriiglobus ruber]OWK37719.1 Multidrug resistance protein [function not yet clear] [Fimbriiglobus ruber]
MTATNRTRALPWVIGVSLLAFTAIGANKLLHPADAPGGPGAPPRPPVPATEGGVVLLGTVDSVPGPIRFGPPGVMMLATVKQVLVKEGDEVKENSALVQFDDAVYQAKLKQARAGLEQATQGLKKAETDGKEYPIKVARQKDALKLAQDRLEFGEKSLGIATEKFDRALPKTNPRTGVDFTPTEREQELTRQREEDPDLRQLKGMLLSLRTSVEDEQNKVKELDLISPEVGVRVAKAKVEEMAAQISEAQAAVDACLIRVPANLGGVIEQVFAAPGMTFGPSSREPVLVLVPHGKRIVRAEVEAEFAFKVTDKVGKKVVVYDANNFALTYDGVVTRIPGAYLPKRSSFDAFVPSTSKVIECIVEITDPAPAGKPPLLVGQPVRVSIP